MKTLKSLILALLLVGVPSLFIGCKGSLAPGGAYAPMTTNAVTGAVQPTQAPDLAFFQVDFGFSVAYDTAELAFSAERNNRALLWKVSPDIKRTLDKLRPDFVMYVKDYGLARAAYQANPIPPNLDEMSTILAKFKALTAAAAAVIPQPTNSPAVNPSK